MPYVSNYQFSGGVSYSISTTGTTYSFANGVSASNTLTPVAGLLGLPGFGGDGSPAISAKLQLPIGINYDNLGNLYIADSSNRRIRKVNAGVGGIITTIAGINNPLGNYSGDTSPAIAAELESAIDVAVDNMYNVYIVGNAASSTHNVIRKIDFGTGKIDVFSGGGGAGYNGDGGPCFDLSVQFNNPKGLHISNFGFGTANPVLYVADYDNHVIRQIDLVTNIITTVAGDGTSGWSGDGGLATSAQLKKPTSVSYTHLTLPTNREV